MSLFNKALRSFDKLGKRLVRTVQKFLRSEKKVVSRKDLKEVGFDVIENIAMPVLVSTR